MVGLFIPVDNTNITVELCDSSGSVFFIAQVCNECSKTRKDSWSAEMSELAVLLSTVIISLIKRERDDHWNVSWRYCCSATESQTGCYKMHTFVCVCPSFFFQPARLVLCVSFSLSCLTKDASLQKYNIETVPFQSTGSFLINQVCCHTAVTFKLEVKISFYLDSWKITIYNEGFAFCNI